MKKLYITLGIIFMLGLVSAVALGSIFTQEQVNNIDVDAFDLGEGFVRDNSNKIISTCEEGICSVDVSMLSIDKEMLLNETDNETYWSKKYISVNRIKPIRFNKVYWAEYRDEHGATEARQELSKDLLVKRGRLVEAERNYLKNIQEYEDVDLSEVLNALE